MTRNHIELKIHKQFIEWCWTPQAHRWPDAVITLPRKVRVGRRTIEVQAPTLAFFHPANGEARDAKTGSLLHAMGVRRGILDLWLPVPREEYCGLVLELKAPGKKMSPDQKTWTAFLKNVGWKVLAVYSFSECVEETTRYLDMKTRGSDGKE